MKPGIIYQGIFVNIETDVTNTNVQQECTLNIYDTETLIDDADDPVIIPLEMTDRPVSIEVIDNSEDNFTPVRPKQLTAEIFSSDQVNISTFAEGGDNRYKVEYLTENENPFLGWLSISDLSQEFMPDPNVITLIAGDGLGFLKDIPLTDFDNENPGHENQIMDYLAWVFSKTGFQLNIVCCFNIRSRYAIPLNQEGQAPLTINTVFQFSPTVAVRTNPTTWFYEGMRFTTDDPLNPGPFTVESITLDTLFTDVFVSESFVSSVGLFTFTDLAVTGDGHFFKHEWLDAKTGENDIGTQINAFDWLCNILREEGSAYQDNGSWFIMRKDEYEYSHNFFLFTFDYQGNFVSRSEETFEKSIGVGLSLSWMNDNANISLERPSKSVTETYDYLTPKEIPDNADYDRGDVTTRVVEAGYTAYNLDDWAIGNLWGSATTIPTIDAVILRSFNTFGDEITRFIMLTQPPGTTGAFEYIRSSPIPIGFMDRFTWSFDVSAMTNPGGDGTLQICFIVLYGESGTVYICNPADTGTTWLNDEPQPALTWHITDNQLSLFRTGLRWALHDSGSNVTVKTEWANCEMSAPSVPEDGEVRIFLFAGNQSASAFDNLKIRYQNLNFDYRAYIGGTYQKYKGQEHKVEGGTNTVAARDEKVQISDSPKRLFKGALLRTNGLVELFSGSIVFGAPNALSVSGYKVTLFDTSSKIILSGTNAGVYTINEVVYHVIGDTTEINFKEQTITTVTETATISKYLFTLASQFYNALVYPDGDFPEDAVHPYGHLQVFDVWNQYNRTMTKADGTVDGLDTSTVIPDLKYKYFLTDANMVTNNKMFQLLHFSHEKHLCEWKAFLHEVADSTIDKNYTGNTFKYIT